MRHKTWQYLIDWTSSMTRKHGGGTVIDKSGKRWDWGQALTRDVYGADWMNSPDLDRVNDIPDNEPAPPELVMAARNWESGTVPKWVKGVA